MAQRVQHADNQRYAQASVESYYTDEDAVYIGRDIDDIYPLVKERIDQLEDASQRDGVHHNEIVANKLLCKFYEERQRGRSGNADADADAP